MNRKILLGLISFVMCLSLLGASGTDKVGAQQDTQNHVNSSCADATLVGCWQMEEGSGTAIIDGSSYGNNGLTTGSPTWVAGRDGLALSLNGTTQYAIVPDNNSLDITGNITLSAWIKPSKLFTQNIMKKTIGTTTANGYELSLGSSGKVFVRFNGNASYRVDSLTSYPTNGNTWMHIAATYDGTTLIIYINGVQDNTKAASFTISANATDLGIGVEPAPTKINFYQGTFDDLRIYNRALTSDQIKELYGADLSITKDDGRAGALPGDSTTYTIVASNSGTLTVSGITVADSFPAALTGISWTCLATGVGSTCTASGSDNINDTITLAAGGFATYTANATISPSASGVIINTATVTPPVGFNDPNTANNTATDYTALRTGGSLCGSDSNLIACYQLDEGMGNIYLDGVQNIVYNDGTTVDSPTWVPGVVGSALNFNGSSQYGYTTEEGGLDIADALTLAAWIKPSSESTQYLIKKGNTGVTSGYELALAAVSGSSGAFFFRINSNATCRVDSSVKYSGYLGSWVHIAATYDRVNLHIYVNGIQVDDEATPCTAAIGLNDLLLTIGAQSDGGSKFTGSMDDVRVYNRALTPTEIAALVNPTAVNLVGFRATSIPYVIQLDWQTGQEFNLLGFNLLRAEAVNGTQLKINPQQIPAINPGQLQGNTYRYVDISTEAGKTYYYWVEWVGNTGSELFGPLTASLAPYTIWLPMGLR